MALQFLLLCWTIKSWSAQIMSHLSFYPQISSTYTAPEQKQNCISTVFLQNKKVKPELLKNKTFTLGALQSFTYFLNFFMSICHLIKLHIIFFLQEHYSHTLNWYCFHAQVWGKCPLAVCDFLGYTLSIGALLASEIMARTV